MFSAGVWLWCLQVLNLFGRLASSSLSPFQYVLLDSLEDVASSPQDDVDQNYEPDWHGTPLETGLVAFGDSYAAGIGTPHTSWDSCRYGRYAYPSLLRYEAHSLVHYEMRQCTGARTDALLLPGGQIDSWLSTSLANFGTLSVGGDDLDFALILDACVLRWQGPRSPDCEELIGKARESIDGELGPRMLEAVKRIVQKSEREEFELYWTGYPRFFNTETEWCNNVTFWFWRPEHHHDAPRGGGEWAYLTREHRRMLNSVVDELNALIRKVVREAAIYFNNDHKVVYFDSDQLFEGHRFCDVGLDGTEVQEPDANRNDTWFFLSGWGDNPDRLPGQRELSSEETLQEQAEDMGIGDRLSMPPPLQGNETCLMRYEESRNSTEYVLCSIEMAVDHALIQNRPAETAVVEWWSSHQPMILETDDEPPQRGIGWYWPTQWVKTFHPRSRGYFAIKDEIVRYWKVRSGQKQYEL